MLDSDIPFWPASWANPFGERQTKPRSRGLTMVIDKGLGLNTFHDLMELAAPHIDIYKLGFGTSTLYPAGVLYQKVALAKALDLHIMPGGTLFEIAIRHSPPETYMARLLDLGFNAVEISDGTFPLSADMRRRAIAAAADAGLTVYTEFGKKAAHFRAERDDLLRTLEQDVRAGASYVIVEARESGTVGVFDGKGMVDHAFLQEIAQAAGDHAGRLIWEAPHKEQQVALIRALGCDVNLGNVAYTDILAVETLRRGLRADTAGFLEGRRTAPCE
ncbi:phosphosulfolactate synthase [Brevibacillus thermoruber]|uniref:phosphosulfolactate synthase n=1 Tax=Brevibacillus thermoruber TaxID=33942 RepID=UPI0005528E24|nr:phosphosulfolactate synthase [Brevibacillus thermoruber]